MRQVINAILYIVVRGIQWRMLPKEYPKWQSVYSAGGPEPGYEVGTGDPECRDARRSAPRRALPD